MHQVHRALLEAILSEPSKFPHGTQRAQVGEACATVMEAGDRGSTHTPTNSAKLASDICKAVFDGSLEKLNFLELYAGATSSSLSKEIKTTR